MWYRARVPGENGLMSYTASIMFRDLAKLDNDPVRLRQVMRMYTAQNVDVLERWFARRGGLETLKVRYVDELDGQGYCRVDFEGFA